MTESKGIRILQGAGKLCRTARSCQGWRGVRIKMEKEDTKRQGYWERFLQTGSVADYLNYTAGSENEHQPEREDVCDRAKENRRDTW